MNYIEPTVELYMEKDPLLKLERCIRVAYKSESKIKEGSAEKLIKAILSHHHTSTLEHYRIRVLCDSTIRDNVSIWQEKRGRAFIQIKAGDDEYDSVLIGNLRAFLDLIYSADCDFDTRWIIQDLLYTEFPKIFNEVVIYPANFESLDFDSVKYDGEDTEYATFHVVTNRAVLGEITRHRTLSPTVESTRYCDYQSNGISICTPYPYNWSPEPNENFQVWVDNLIFDWADNHPEYVTADGIITHAGMYELARLAKIQGIFESAMKNAELSYNALKDLGERPQSARCTLPMALKSEMYLTGTFEAWNHFIKLRTAPDADPQIQYIAKMIAEYINQLRFSHQEE